MVAVLARLATNRRISLATSVAVPFGSKRKWRSFTPHANPNCHLARIVTDTRSMLYLRPVGSRKMFVGWPECDRLHGVQDMVAEDPDDYNQNAYFESLVDMLRSQRRWCFSPNRLR